MAQGSRRDLHILLVNDDGIDAPGLAALESAAYTVTDQVSVVAPAREHSGQGHAITVREPVYVTTYKHPLNRVRHAIGGTPVDCVRIAILELCDQRPDLVLSGINNGANVGWDIFYSGTVSAASEACSFGLPAAAISLASVGDHHFHTAEAFQNAERTVARLLASLVEEDLSRPFLYNFNVPAVPPSEVRGVLVTRPEINVKGDAYERRVSPNGQTYYWATWGRRREEFLSVTDQVFDIAAVRNRFVSLSKLQYDVSAPDQSGALARRYGAIGFEGI